MQAGNGVSPLVPILLFALTVYGWALLQMWRIGGPRLGPVVAAAWIDGMVGRTDDTWRQDLNRLLASAAGLPSWWLAWLLTGFLPCLGVCDAPEHRHN